MAGLFSRIRSGIHGAAGAVYGRKYPDAGQSDAMAAEIVYMMENSVRIVNYSSIWGGLGDTKKLAAIGRYLEGHKRVCDSLRYRERRLGLSGAQVAEIEGKIAQANRIIEYGTFYGMNEIVSGAQRK